MSILLQTGGIIPQGKSGQYTFYQLNGKTVMRRLPTGKHRNKTHPTPLQKLYRERFREVNAFLKPFKEVLNFGFQNQSSQTKKGMHCAFQSLVRKGYNFGEQPRIDPAYLKVSEGGLLGPEEVELSRENRLIRIRWKDNSQKGSTFLGGKLMLFLLHPESGNYHWFQDYGRMDQSQTMLELSVKDAEKTWCVYLAFYQEHSRGRIEFSDSVYAGRV